MNESKMNGMKLKRSVQTLTLAMVLAYTSLLIYQSLSHGMTQPSQQQQQQQPQNVVNDDGKSSRDYSDLVLGAAAASNRIDFGDLRAKKVPAYNSLTSEKSPSVTATRKPPMTKLDDVFISVKTTKHYHNLRLSIIVKTWFQLAKNQTWFFTDADDEEFERKTNGHMVNTNCSPTHCRKALCCKTSVEFDTFLESDKDWFCHFDDDNYVNVPRLVRFLADYNAQEDWYFGKTSIPAPFLMRQGKKVSRNISFWFATGGAGYCVSRSLALKMIPFASRGKFVRACEKIRLPDDVTMGYIIEYLLSKPLTVVDLLHSHLEPMELLQSETLHDQISFSYHRLNNNVLKIDGFDVKYDPTRFLSLHCFLFPYFSFCPK